MGAPVLVHLQAKKSWWSGRVTALCGHTAEAGEYKRPGWFTSTRTCPACQRIYQEGTKR